MMNQLKAQGRSFTRGSEQQSSFEKLKVAIATAPVLVVVDPRKPFVWRWMLVLAMLELYYSKMGV